MSDNKTDSIPPYNPGLTNGEHYLDEKVDKTLTDANFSDLKSDSIADAELDEILAGKMFLKMNKKLPVQIIVADTLGRHGLHRSYKAVKEDLLAWHKRDALARVPEVPKKADVSLITEEEWEVYQMGYQDAIDAIVAAFGGGE